MEKKNFNQKKDFKGVKQSNQGNRPFGKRPGKPGQPKVKEKKDNNKEEDVRLNERKQEEVSFKKKRYTKEEFEAAKKKYIKKYADYKTQDGINLSDYEERNSGITTVKMPLECLPDSLGKIPPMLKVGQNVTFKAYKSRYSDSIAVLMQSMDGRKALLTQKVSI